jgi:hypothetical protein
MEFVKKKKREAVKQLKTLKKVLEHEGFSVESHLEDDDDNDPYIFLKGKGSLSFDGVRIYKIGDSIAYRVQKEAQTHPYGRAYLLDVESNFNELMAEMGSEEKAGKELIESLRKEFTKFFQKSLAAERELKTADFVDDGEPDSGSVIVHNASMDYATSIGSRIG